MKTIRYLIISVSALMGIWVSASFASIVLATGNIEFWVASLMWGLLSGLIVMPVLVFAYDANRRRERKEAQRRAALLAASPVTAPSSFVGSEEKSGALPVDDGAESTWRPV